VCYSIGVRSEEHMAGLSRTVYLQQLLNAGLELKFERCAMTTHVGVCQAIFALCWS